MRKLAIAAVLALSAVGPALAECYDELGCTDTDRFTRSALNSYDCDALWEIRNTIYYEHGYCFVTERAKSYFGNDQCYVRNAKKLGFSRIEQHNIDTIASVEKAWGC